MSGERRPGSSRSSLARAPSGRARADEEEGLGLDGGVPAPAMDAPEEVEVAPTPKARAGPVTVGRSLEISVTPEVCMELLVDKLKLLDYESGFCKKKKPYRKPLTVLYFAWALPNGNHGEQFFYFTSLTSWLLGLAGVELAPPKEHEDPNLACNNIIASVKKLGFAAPSYPPMKLTSGYGKEVCGVLDGLVDFVLERSNFTYKKPLYLPDGYVEDTDGGGDGVDEDPDMGALDGADDFKLPEDKDDGMDEEEAYSELGLALPPGAKPKGKDGGAAGELADKAVVQSKVDPTAWRLELERVGPKLRILLNADAKDWRTNLEEVHSHSKAISTAWPESKGVLEKLRSDLNNSLEKLTTRERFLNEQFERLMQQYRAQRQQLLDVQNLFNKHSEAFSDRNTEFERIKEQLGEMKQQMEDRGSNISDATPVVKIKKAIEKVKEELHEMEVRIGVVSHTFLQHTLKSRRAQHQHAAAGSDDDDM